MPDPRIVNAHEHLLESRRSLAKLDEVDARTGVSATALMASSRYTFTLAKGTGFIEHHRNNQYLCRLARENPGRYYAFVTFHPDGKQDADMVSQLKEYLAQGATGVKLYLGHGGKLGDGSPFHVRPLDDPVLLPFYQFCEQNHVPIVFHVNMGQFGDEARRVFTRYPDLIVILPHMGLMSRRLLALEQLLTEHPSLYTDMSFGWWYSVDGLTRISKGAPGQIQIKGQSFYDFVMKHQDRLLFGTDVVITDAAVKSTNALTDFWLAYRAVLELPEYDFRDREGKVHRFTGLSLPRDVLEKIYHGNWEHLLEQTGRSPSAAAAAK